MFAGIGRSTIAFAAMIAVFLLQTQHAAQSEDIIFNASATTSGEACIIELQREGQLGISPNLRTFNSERNGGFGALVQVTSRKQTPSPTPGFEITLEPPTSFTTAPAGGNDNVSWRTRFLGTSISNGVNFNRRNGTRSVDLPDDGTSITQVTGHLRARKPRGDVFPGGGLYRAEALFRCE